MTPPLVRIATRHDDAWRSDDCSVTAVVVDGDEIRLDVLYSGGCRVHQFDLMAFPEEGSPDVRLRLRHNGQGDPCKALVGETLRFSLAAVAQEYPEDPVVVLHLGEVGTFDYAPGDRPSSDE